MIQINALCCIIFVLIVLLVKYYGMIQLNLQIFALILKGIDLLMRNKVIDSYFVTDETDR